jgi:hypothetical protein
VWVFVEWRAFGLAFFLGERRFVSLAEVSGGYGDGGYGCGFGAEDSRAEGYWLPFVLGEERDFFRGPAAFGSDGYGVGDLVFGCLVGF